MRDQRAESLAQILVRYSTKVSEGDVCVVQSTTSGEPLAQAVYEEVLRAGGLPVLQLTTDDAGAAFYELASDAQLDWIPPTATWAAENADVRIYIDATANVRDLSRADPAKQARAQKARKPLLDTTMRRAATGEYRWCVTLFPTHAFASEAGMSLAQYEQFYYSACLATDTSSARSRPRPSWSLSAAATEHSKAAEDDRPAPDGTSPSTLIDSPGSWWPRSLSAQATPAA